MSKKLPWIVFIILAAIIIGLFLLSSNFFVPSGKFDSFAQCLKDREAVFYGAFWCPHCQNQKAMFGDSAKLLPYVECSTADGSAQLPVCQEKNINSYPTWVFSDGSRLSGEIPLKTLSEKTACPLPQ